MDNWLIGNKELSPNSQEWIVKSLLNSLSKSKEKKENRITDKNCKRIVKTSQN